MENYSKMMENWAMVGHTKNQTIHKALSMKCLAVGYFW